MSTGPAPHRRLGRRRPAHVRGVCLTAALAGLATATADPQPSADNDSSPIDAGAFPARVHVVEDFETEIEKRWWLRGEPVGDPALLAPSLSAIPNRRAMRATASKDFDQKMRDQSADWKAVIFNPVPGPPMGPRTRLAFRYRLAGTAMLRVQIYSLTHNYHRHLVLENLPQDAWQHTAVDMTKARRPDGSGGPLSEDERIDDIQFYIDPRADLLIDDIVLYDAAPEREDRPFPKRVIFTGWFDTGEQGAGKEWPGDFAIVPHEGPRTWDAAQAVPDPATGAPWIRLGLRGERPLGRTVDLRFRYRIDRPSPITVELPWTAEGGAESVAAVQIDPPAVGTWTEAIVRLLEAGDRAPVPRASELRFRVPDADTVLQVDDVLIHEP